MYNNGKAKIKQDFNGLKISIPSNKNFFSILFLCTWLGGWYFGEVSAINEVKKLESFDNFFLIAWLVGWTIGGLYAIKIVLWSLFGQEKFSISNYEMTLQDSTLGIGKKIRFGLNQINKLSLNNNENGISSSILIEVGFKTYSFGSNLDTAEAQYLLGLIQQKVPQIPHSE
ncbi:hypothetical protein [Acinetobacter equi]|uniref:Uncharacterized protein n=1 Tax=Acinetobacter equi TaxID=1324350 RepID=A0A0N9VEG8_9GAMM|nr:hypothetical protein [Acinetobacter equi]ALH95804.1 hypothetical protein AOY20_09850 [Acinetobacter equi]